MLKSKRRIEREHREAMMKDPFNWEYHRGDFVTARWMVHSITGEKVRNPDHQNVFKQLWFNLFGEWNIFRLLIPAYIILVLVIGWLIVVGIMMTAKWIFG